MQFSIKEWRRSYDKVHVLGRMLRDSHPTYTEEGNYIAPVTELSKDAQLALESEIKSLTQRSSKYLDQCGLRPSKPLWHYDRKNPETHMSAPEFKYGHLLGAVA
jgi:hypothetical protein